MITERPALPRTPVSLSRRRLLRSGAAVGAGLALAPLLAACSSDDSTSPAGGPTGAPRRGGTLRMAYLSTPSDSIDPLMASDFLSNARLLQVYEKLALLGPDQQVRPLLYERADHNADGTEWTFVLKPGIRYADGREMTAADVLASLATQAQTGAGTSLTAIDLTRSHAVDARTVRLLLAEPTADLEYRFAAGYFTVMPDGRSADSADKLNGSGPYRVESFTAGQRSVLVRRPDYWGGEARGLLDRLELTAVPEPAARVNALLTGQIDWADNISFVDADTHRTNPKVVLHPTAVPDGLGWFLNATAPPFDDARVRLAFKLAVDREALVTATTFGLGRPGNDLWGDGLPWYATGLPQRTRDVERARSLLAEAGRDRVPVSILASPMGPGLVDASHMVVDQAKQAGFDVTVEEMPVDVFYADPSRYYNYAATTFSWTAAFPYMAQFLYLPDSTYNFGWKNDDWTRRFKAAGGLFDTAARQAAYDALQRELWESGPDLVWGLAPKQTATSPKVGGVDTIGDPTVPDLSGVWLAS